MKCILVFKIAFVMQMILKIHIVSSSMQEIGQEIECGQGIELSTIRDKINVNLSGKLVKRQIKEIIQNHFGSDVRFSDGHGIISQMVFVTLLIVNISMCFSIFRYCIICNFLRLWCHWFCTLSHGFCLSTMKCLSTYFRIFSCLFYSI